MSTDKATPGWPLLFKTVKHVIFHKVALYLPNPKHSMASNQKLIQRNTRIRQRFTALTDKKRLAVDYALELLADEFLPLEENTIWLIVSRTGYYKNL